jgi:hypothetical protein
VITRKFTIDELDDFTDDVRLLESHGKNRWSEHSTIVFTADDSKFYVVDIEEGLTEYQDYSGSDRYPDAVHVPDGDDFVECLEVEIYEEMVPQRKWRAK